MIDVDDLSIEARSAIVEHAKNLSAAGPSTLAVVPDGSAPAAAQTQFPSESGHWYDPKTGNQIELPPRTQARTAIKRGLVPGVTSVTKVAHKEAIQRWMVNRAIRFSAQVIGEYNDPAMPIGDDFLISEVWQLLNADSEAITGRGKELHAAIGLFCTNPHAELCDKWDKHIAAVIRELSPNGISIRKGNTEHSFATSRYGGKIDWHNDEWLLDFKTRENLEGDTRWAVMRKGNTRATKVYDLKNEAEQAITSDEYYIELRHDLAWPEHAQQLAAYAWGLFPFKQYSEKAFMFSDNKRRCANVFIGVEDAEVVFHEWSEKDLLKGWRKFEALLNVWWCDYEH